MHLLGIILKLVRLLATRVNKCSAADIEVQLDTPSVLPWLQEPCPCKINLQICSYATPKACNGTKGITFQLGLREALRYNQTELVLFLDAFKVSDGTWARYFNTLSYTWGNKNYPVDSGISNSAYVFTEYRTYQIE